MQYHLILVLVLCQELRYLFPDICTEELISSPKKITFFPTLPSDNENSERKSNRMLYPLYLYLSRSAFLVSFTDPNKQLLNAKYVFTFFI